ncbi:MAG: lipoyl synthase [Magnetococcales bacterium]|nr:lipoyl synthase [Magnetococcales bacterium]
MAIGQRTGPSQGVGSLAGKPHWLKVRAPTSEGFRSVQEVVRRHRLHTVCESASCPNMGECWHAGTATFMILGNLCTRRCAFCAVTTARPGPLDPDEPVRLATAVREMRLAHVVITSVDRDDLPDGGAGQFAACIAQLHTLDIQPVVEVLTPDFRDKPGALEQVVAAGPTIFNHNIETVPRLYATVRPVSGYDYSLGVLRRAGDLAPGLAIKSGFMVGLGEQDDEVEALLVDLRQAGVTLLTVGQYLRPSLAHHPVLSYRPPEWFAQLRERALALGFTGVASHPLARSSHQARQLYGASSQVAAAQLYGASSQVAAARQSDR